MMPRAMKRVYARRYLLAGLGMVMQRFVARDL